MIKGCGISNLYTKRRQNILLKNKKLLIKEKNIINLIEDIENIINIIIKYRKINNISDINFFDLLFKFNIFLNQINDIEITILNNKNDEIEEMNFPNLIKLINKFKKDYNELLIEQDIDEYIIDYIVINLEKILFCYIILILPNKIYNKITDNKVFTLLSEEINIDDFKDNKVYFDKNYIYEMEFLNLKKLLKNFKILKFLEYIILKYKNEIHKEKVEIFKNHIDRINKLLINIQIKIKIEKQMLGLDAKTPIDNNLIKKMDNNFKKRLTTIKLIKESSNKKKSEMNSLYDDLPWYNLKKPTQKISKK